MESSVLGTIGVEVIDVMSPVSVCMFIVVLLVYALSSPNPFSAAPIRTAANLVYLESPSDSAATKFEGALLNAVVVVVVITLVTFFIFLLYYYNFTSFLKAYMRISAFFVLATMGGSIFLSIIQHFAIPVDSVSCLLLLFNFTVVGVLSVFSAGFPIFLRQAYMVALGIFMAAWFTRLPEWTTWVLLAALSVYDLAAVLAPGGPLKLLVELAARRNEEIPALIYEARPSAPPENRRSNSALFLAGVSDSGSVELQTVPPRASAPIETRGNHDNSVPEISPFASNSRDRVLSEDASPANSSLIDHQNVSQIAVDEETSSLVELLGVENETERQRTPNADAEMFESRGIKLGLGDFIFYSVLVGRAAMYDLMTVYACYLAIISGLGCTLIWLSVCRRALPALPISITLGIVFYFLTRLLMEPFVVGTMTNLLMF